jgi:hypothetical protein
VDFLVTLHASCISTKPPDVVVVHHAPLSKLEQISHCLRMMALCRQVQRSQIISIPRRHICPILDEKSHSFNDGIPALRRQVQSCLSLLITIPTRPVHVGTMCQGREGSTQIIAKDRLDKRLRC